MPDPSPYERPIRPRQTQRGSNRHCDSHKTAMPSSNEKLAGRFAARPDRFNGRGEAFLAHGSDNNTIAHNKSWSAADPEGISSPHC